MSVLMLSDGERHDDDVFYNVSAHSPAAQAPALCRIGQLALHSS